ncbi:MAG TPA: glycosyltransferase [Acidimicrobiales bacterium]|nr:glycosyltransferase [Acidimicrobiales bacterium]
MLVTTFPGKGHFHPVAPLALAMRRVGHDVRVATHPGFGRWVEACGLSVLPAGRSQEELVAATAALPSPERSIHEFTTEWVPSFASDVLSSADAWRPELVVSEEGEHGGPLLAALLEIPAVTHSWPAPARPLEVRAALVDALDDIWRAFGCNAPPRPWGDLYLDCCPPPLQTTDIETVAGVITVRPSAFDGPSRPPPPWLEDLVRPVVFVTLGTVPLFARADVLRFIVDAIRPVAGTVVVATGPLPETVVPPHPRVHLARYVPLSGVLPTTDLVVSHGGASTSVACLLAAVPQLVIAQGAPSQHRIAAAIAKAGVGIAIDALPVEPEALALSVRELLTDNDVVHRIHAALATLDRLPPPEEVADYLAEL